MDTQVPNSIDDTSMLNNSNSSTPNSVRSSSNKGQFVRYKNMFDSLLRNKSREKYRQTLNADTSTILPDQLANKQLANLKKKLDTNGGNSLCQNSFLDMPLSDDEKSSHIQNTSSRLLHSSMSSSFSIDERETTRNSSMLAAVFYGVSDETSSMLNSIISGNEQIAEFFDKPLHSLSGTNTTLTTSMLKQNIEDDDNTPIKNSSSSENIDTIYSSVYSSSVSSLSPSSKSSSETSANNDSASKQWHHRPVSLERSKIILNNQKRVDLNNKSHLFEKVNMANSGENSAVTTLSSINSLSDIFSLANFELNLNSIFLDVNDADIQQNSQNEENIKKTTATTTTTESTHELTQISSAASTATTNNQPKCESVYFELDEFDFSSDEDDSYETESNEYDGESCEKLNETDSFHSKVESTRQEEPSPAPPKPKRTFEHDVYVHLKEEDISGKNNFTKSNRTFRNNQVKSMYNENVTQLNEHIYETLPSIRDFNNQNVPSQDTLNINKLENKTTSTINVATNKAPTNDIIKRKLRLNNLNVKKNMV